MDCAPLKKLIREVPDFPKPGILFYDITTLLKDRLGFAQLIDALTAHYLEKDIDLVLGIEARGFIFGPALAYRLNAGFVPVRKPKKLPAETVRWTYRAGVRPGHAGNAQGRRSSPASASSSSTTCWLPAAQPTPRPSWRNRWAPTFAASLSWSSWTS